MRPPRVTAKRIIAWPARLIRRALRVGRWPERLDQLLAEPWPERAVRRDQLSPEQLDRLVAELSPERLEWLERRPAEISRERLAQQLVQLLAEDARSP